MSQGLEEEVGVLRCLAAEGKSLVNGDGGHEVFQTSVNEVSLSATGRSIQHKLAWWKSYNLNIAQHLVCQNILYPLFEKISFFYPLLGISGSHMDFSPAPHSFPESHFLTLQPHWTTAQIYTPFQCFPCK